MYQQKPAYLNVDLKKLNHTFKPLTVFSKTIEYLCDHEDTEEDCNSDCECYEEDPNNYIESIWHHATLTYEQLCPSDDTRYNDHSYEMIELYDIIQTYGIKPGYYPIFWDHLDELTERTGIDYKNNDEELLKLCIKETEKLKK